MQITDIGNQQGKLEYFSAIDEAGLMPAVMGSRKYIFKIGIFRKIWPHIKINLMKNKTIKNIASTRKSC